MKHRTHTYIVQTQPGFEAIAAEELRDLVPGTTEHSTRSIADKNGMLLFNYAGDPQDLFELRTVEDIFIQVARIPNLPPSVAGLRMLRDITLSAQIEPALQIARQIAPGRGGRGRIRFRVVSRQVGRTAYRRVDAQNTVERAIMARSDHRWGLEQEGALEFWLTLLPKEAILALRLSDERMRHREYKFEHMPASLRPTAAAALVWLTRPQNNDVFLDPMCGAGTTLIERAHAGRYAQLYGGDIREEALKLARSNIGTRYQPIEIQQWDARNLPLDAGSISAATVNLPFGQQIGSVQENNALYPAVLRELTRVLRPGARLAALTGDRRNIDSALRRSHGLQLRKIYPVQLLGRPAAVYVIERT